MTEFTTYRCNAANCEKTYSASNGWFLLQRRGRYFVVGQWYAIKHYDQQDNQKPLETVDLSEYEHYCGVSCLFKRISELTGKAT